MPRKSALLFALAAAALSVSPSVAARIVTASTARAETPLDSAAVVAEVRRVIAERYVLPERRPALDAVLAEGLADGRYDVADPVELAARINGDLQRVGQDKHLNFSYDPAAAARLARNDRDEWDPAAYRRQTRLMNHGVSELRILPGNVRLMTYDGFHASGPESTQAVETAMRFLAEGDAVIIDLRHNGGGSPVAVQYLISHFLPADTPLVTFHMNGEPEPDSLSALAEVPAGRMIGRPLYVLTSGGTASAAEEFTGHVLGNGIGEVVGANTAGAGFRNALVPVAGQFQLSVSVGRAVLASTGRDWEGVGHAPTIPADVSDALEVAHAHALHRLAGEGAADERPVLEALAEAVDARVSPRRPELPLAAYAGTYGERMIRVDGGGLVYQRGERAPSALITLGGHRFAFEADPQLILTFDAAGPSVSAFEIQRVGEDAQGRFIRD